MARHEGHIEGIAACVLVGALLVAQGGYYAIPCTVAAVVCVVLAAAGILRPGAGMDARTCVIAAAFALVGFANIASALANGASYAQLAAGAPWFLFAAAFLAFSTMAEDGRRCALRAVAWLGAACGAAGILMCVGAIPYESGVYAQSGRLAFFFQYPNTAGIWFCAMSVLALCEDDARLNWLAFPSMAALCLTSSGGAALVALCGYAFLAARWIARRDVRRACALVVQGALALGVRAAYGLGPGWACAAAAGAGLVVCAVCWRADVARGRRGERVGRVGDALGGGCGRLLAAGHKRVGTRRAIAGVAVAALACVAVVAVAVLAFPERVAQAQTTFLSRVIQMQDGLSLLSDNLLLGIGPDRWRFEYRFVQSASYSAARMHNGYLQLALDAGLVGLCALLIGLAGTLVRALRRARVVGGQRGAEAELGALVAVACLLAHAVVDFDLSYGAVLALLALLLDEPRPARLPDCASAASPRAHSRAADGVCVALCVCVAAAVEVGLWAGFQHDSIEAQLDGDDLAAACEQVRSEALARNDEALATAAISALAETGAWEDAVELADSLGGPRGSEQALACARCRYALGDDAAAEEAVLAELEAEPCNRALFRAAKALFEQHGLGVANEARYRAAVERANALLSSGNNALAFSTASVASYEADG